MDRLEKVIKGLEFCTTYPCYCIGCPYDETCGLDADELMRDALFLLKESRTDRTEAGFVPKLEVR